MNQVEIPLKLTGIGAIKKELRDLKGQIANATDPEQMTKLAQRAGELADQLKDANEQVAIFNSGSRFEAASNAFGMIKQDLMSLDFEGAAQKAKIFQTAMAGISSKDISGAFKGLISTVSTLGQTFVRFGVMLLTNPIFLLVAVITAIVAGIVLFLNKMGILKKAFEILMIPVNAAIQAFKDMTDWLGLTDHAGQEAAENEKKRREQQQKQHEQRIAELEKEYNFQLFLNDSQRVWSDNEVQNIQNQIDLAEAQGKNTDALQIKKLKKAREVANKEIEIATDNMIKLMAIDAEKAKAAELELGKKIQAEKDAANAILVLQTKINEDYKKNRLDAARSIKDLELELVKDATERELRQNKVKYDRLIADLKTNEKLIASEREKLKDFYLKLQAEEDAKIQKKAKDEELKRAQELADGLNAITEERREREKAGFLAEIQSQKEKTEKLKEYNDALIESEKGLFDARLGFARGLISGLTELAGENKKIANALFLVDKALAIGEIIVNTQREISGYWSNPTWKLLPDGGAALAASASTAAKIRAATSIASIAASTISKFIGGGGGSIPSGGGGSAPTATATAQATPAVNLFGQGNQLNQVGAPTSVESNQNITVQAVVSETDVTSTQTKIDKIKKNAEL